MASQLLMDMAYKCGSYAGGDGGEKAKWFKGAHIMRSEAGNVYAKVDVLMLAPSVAMLMAAAGTKLEDYVLMSVFDRRDDDPAELLYKVCYVCGHYDDAQAEGGKKAQWETFAKVWKSGKGKHYAKVTAAALNPTVLMQFRQSKEEISRELFFQCFLDTPDKRQGDAGAPPEEVEKDEIPS